MSGVISESTDAIKPGRELMDSLSAHVALLDGQGVILEVNRAWLSFERENTPPGREEYSSLGLNYIELCDAASGPESEEARAVADGLRAVISGRLQEFALEYPCHSPTKKRWFNVRAVRMLGTGPLRLLMTHENITNVKLAQEALVQSETQLRTKSRMLEEANAALKVILRQREEDRLELEEKVSARVGGLVLPYVERLEESRLDREQAAWLDLLKSNLMEIVSPFARRLSSQLLALTPTEIQVADMVRQGRSSKEIAELLGVSKRTVDFHRDKLRKKLGLGQRKENLRTFLLSLE